MERSTHRLTFTIGVTPIASPKMKNGCPLVIVEWVDSAQPQSCWKFLEDVGTPDSIHCVSVGWLVSDGEENKSVAPNMGGVNDPGSMQVSGIITIPVCSIVKITPLQEPALAR